MAVAAVLTASKLIPGVVSHALSVYNQLQKAKRNNECFEELSDHVKEVADILKRLEEQGVDEDVVKKGLEIFQRALKSAKKLLEDYGRSNKCNTCMYFIKARGWEDRFTRVNSQLGKAKQHLTLVLQVEQRGQNQANECKREEDANAKGEPEVMVSGSSCCSLESNKENWLI